MCAVLLNIATTGSTTIKVGDNGSRVSVMAHTLENMQSRSNWDGISCIRRFDVQSATFSYAGYAVSFFFLYVFFSSSFE